MAEGINATQGMTPDDMCAFNRSVLEDVTGTLLSRVVEMHILPQPESPVLQEKRLTCLDLLRKINMIRLCNWAWRYPRSRGLHRPREQQYQIRNVIRWMLPGEDLLGLFVKGVFDAWLVMSPIKSNILSSDYCSRNFHMSLVKAGFFVKSPSKIPISAIVMRKRAKLKDGCWREPSDGAHRNQPWTPSYQDHRTYRSLYVGRCLKVGLLSSRQMLKERAIMSSHIANKSTFIRTYHILLIGKPRE